MSVLAWAPPSAEGLLFGFIAVLACCAVAVVAHLLEARRGWKHARCPECELLQHKLNAGEAGPLHCGTCRCTWRRAS